MGEEGGVKNLSFFPVEPEGKVFSKIEFPNAIYDIVSSEEGLIVIRTDFSNYFSAFGGLDMITPEGKVVNLDSKIPSYTHSLLGNLFAITFISREPGGEPSPKLGGEPEAESKPEITHHIRIYDLKEKKCIKEVKTRFMIPYVKLISTEKGVYLIYEDLWHIYITAVVGDDQVKLETKKCSNKVLSL
jgi:hypothetical protein